MPPDVDQKRLNHAKDRAAVVVARYADEHSGGIIDEKITAGSLTVNEAYTLLKEVARDPKTGVDRADLLQATMEYEINGANKNGWPLSVAVVDVDDFKLINSELGHVQADDVLKKIAIILRDGTRTSDDVLLGDTSVIRWGGEEFVVLLVHATHALAAEISERLRKNIEIELAGIRSDQKLITVSIGVANWDKNNMATWIDLLTQADQNLMQAKKAGKNQVK